MIGNNLCQLFLTQELFDNTEVHLALLDFYLQASCRVHALVFFVVDMWLMVIIELLTLLLGSLEEIIKGAAKLDRWCKLSYKGISTLHTVELLKELSLRVVDRQAIHPFEAVGDIGVLHRFARLDKSFKAQWKPVMDQDQGKGIVKRL